jgi:hypothetical protein
VRNVDRCNRGLQAFREDANQADNQITLLNSAMLRAVLLLAGVRGFSEGGTSISSHSFSPRLFRVCFPLDRPITLFAGSSNIVNSSSDQHMTRSKVFGPLARSVAMRNQNQLYFRLYISGT